MNNIQKGLMLLAVINWRHPTGAFVDVMYTEGHGWMPVLRMGAAKRLNYADYRDAEKALFKAGLHEDRTTALLAAFTALNLELPSEEE